MNDNNRYYIALLIIKLNDLGAYDNTMVKWTYERLMEKTLPIWINYRIRKYSGNLFTQN